MAATHGALSYILRLWTPPLFYYGIWKPSFLGPTWPQAWQLGGSGLLLLLNMERKNFWADTTLVVVFSQDSDKLLVESRLQQTGQLAVSSGFLTPDYPPGCAPSRLAWAF